MLPVRLSYSHGKQTGRIEALIDSGADDCLFRADIGRAIGIKDIASGPVGEMAGIVPGVQIPVYYHHVNLWVGSSMIKITAGFTEKTSVGAILGRRGFFENFIITFDPSANPPGFDIQRLGRA